MPKRGRIVLIGVTGLELNRSDFYEKELSFQVSCSYGPGRYDPEYEEKGHDYPIGYVRWTEKRNFKAILDLMLTEKLDVKPLITHKFSFVEAEKAYELITGKADPYLGIILDYTEDKPKRDDHKVADITTKYVDLIPDTRIDSSDVIIGFIGAGNFAKRFLLPALIKTDIKLKTIASGGGISATHLAKKFNFTKSTTDAKNIFKDPEINTVFIATKHNTHAHFVIEALRSGKHVFVEKPLCITIQELDKIIEVYHAQIATKIPKLVMVGFNRRFAPHVIKIKELLEGVKKPKSMVMTINAGSIPVDHWTQNQEIGGGRIIGEACHFLDLLCFLADSDIVDKKISRLKNGIGDTFSVQLAFDEGSIGTIHYFANGNNRFPKERLEIFCNGMILQLDNFKILKGYGCKGFRKMKLRRQDKGHLFEIQSFVKAVQKGGPAPIPFEELSKVMRTTINISQTVK